LSYGDDPAGEHNAMAGPVNADSPWWALSGTIRGCVTQGGPG